ncbi:PREDICTED: uncharacterized protein LOC105448094 [Wasmannia auropunctata]|uniref:uncharacterized protein LOC105448094 n=1 Tax=Wasmannia auropunctata TaxID=64793 RepID=UPI0005EED3B9|nr:PREDICTED: uncharacterized protein LOC105448094 [Wasmannia auropunctata]
MAELKKLKAVRAQLKGQVTRINTFLTTTQEITCEQAQGRIDKLQELWLEYNENQTKIVGHITKVKDDAELEAVMQQELPEREIFEWAYYKALDMAHNHSNESSSGTSSSTAGHTTGRTAYDQWMLYKNAFKSLIHDNSKLSDVQKFQYLRSTLEDEALQVISGLNTSAENYVITWDLLKGHYENKKLIINSHLSKLLEFPIVTKDKHVSLKQFVMHLRTHLKALEVLVQPTDQWDTIVIFLARAKLDYQSQRAWEEEIRQQELDHMPKMKEFLKFLNERCRTLEMLDSNINRRESVAKNNTSKRIDKKVALATTSHTCPVCKESHYLFSCSEFLKLSIHDRIAAVKEKQLCINCLKSGHYSRECRSTKCRKCSKSHNTLLHIEQEDSLAKESPKASQKKSEEQAVVMYCTEKDKQDQKTPIGKERQNEKASSRVILATAQVYIRDRQGKRQTCRVLLNPGSQSHFITEDLVRRLQLPYKAESAVINGIARNTTKIEHSTEIKIESQNTAFKTELNCLVVPIITGRLPQLMIDKKLLSVPDKHRLADSEFDRPGPVDILIGAGLFWNLLCVGQIKKVKGQPIWQKTQFGWIIEGELIEARAAETKHALKSRTKIAKLPPTTTTSTGVAKTAVRVATRPHRVATSKRSSSTAGPPPVAALPADEWRLVAIDFGPTSTDPRRRPPRTSRRTRERPTPEAVLQALAIPARVQPLPTRPSSTADKETQTVQTPERRSTSTQTKETYAYDKATQTPHKEQLWSFTRAQPSIAWGPRKSPA